MDLGIRAREVAGALGLRPNTIRAMRLDPSSDHHRSPPGDWQTPIAGLVRDRSAELTELADELGAHGEEGEGTAPRKLKARELRLLKLKDLYSQGPGSVQKAFVEFLAEELEG